MLHNLLAEIAKNVNHDEDPVLGCDDCVEWHGEVMPDEGVPIVKLLRPGDLKESTTYVTRVLTFLFVDDPSYVSLKNRKDKNFPVGCDTKLCVNINHIKI
eukprot:GHVL01034062.1.p1 GENE.GHVL01034062.1~~GHVL01034062.1.p1  ORF type:complete len:100 (+),score=10.52 GHVL01034062.1:333-632(+)